MTNLMSLSRIFFAALAMLLAGCRTTTVGPTPRSLRHDEPNVQNEPFALIKGYAPPGALYDALYAPSTGFIFAVNNRIVNNAADRWNVSVPVKPGKQTVSIQVVRSNRYARGEVVLDVVPFKDYGIRFTTDMGERGGNTFCDMWIIETATGTVASTHTRVGVGWH